MRETSLAYATYWRTSLADADLGKGALRKNDVAGFQDGGREELNNGRASEYLVTQLFKGEADDVETVTVTIRPLVYYCRPEHGKLRKTGAPDIVTPVVTHARVDRSGMIYPSSHTVIPRDILEPLDRGSFSIGAVSDLDIWLQAHQMPDFDRQSIGEQDPEAWHSERWLTYRMFCKEMLETVSNGWPDETDPFVLGDRWFIVKTDNVLGASKHILALYDHLRTAKPDAPLFDRYASEEVSAPEPCLPANAGFSLRLGHASDTYPLSDAQRDAMTHQLVSGHGEILGVNGPPGTGKTTLLLSIVASHWVQAALSDSNPPVIAAASTNNQAVTNIIDAFAKDFSEGEGAFAGRWLPDMKSYGAYFPSADKETEAAERYQTEKFFDRIEDSLYLARAEEIYLKSGSAAFPHLAAPTVQAVVDELAESIRVESGKLKNIEKAWGHLGNARKELFDELGDEPDAALRAREEAAEDAKKRICALDKLQGQWETYLSGEPLLYALFSWLPAVASRRRLKAKVFLKATWPGEFSFPQWESVKGISVYIESLMEKHCDNLKMQQHLVQQGRRRIAAHCDALQRWDTAVHPLALKQASDTLTLAECDGAADVKIRFHAFRLATHFWEGRWLLEMQEMSHTVAEKKRKKGRATVEKRWRRRMKITPCVVSTFHMLPKRLMVSRYEGDNNFVEDYLYDFIDLLIVDEAGQVLPDVAGASFSLAKQALVIGDTQQIEPVWSINPAVDIGNLLTAGVISGTNVKERYDRLCALGKSAASGSVMAIAQQASRYRYDPELARGMFLYEHRRCYDEIVAYCNALCYRNKLRPMRGSGAGRGLFPPLGYLHINGICARRGRASRQNSLEAETIASWIAHHKHELEKHYGKKIHEIVGVVTPFGGQVAAITEACHAKGIPVGKKPGEMTVGTVHSLQGAERDVVIFSPTYSIHFDGQFMDRTPSMLNVAVSRAKDSFLVFGDMELFNPHDKGRPRGLLASFLYREQSNALDFAPLPRRDIGPKDEDFRYIQDAEQHDAFLLEVLKDASREVHVVSPWLRLHGMEKTGILAAMAEATSRGVTVTVYSEQSLNLDRSARTDEEGRRYWLAAAKTLDGARVLLVDVPLLHSKILIQDEAVLCIGSFNWLSAARTGQHARHETSISYTGPKVGAEVKVILQSLLQRAGKVT